MLIRDALTNYRFFPITFYKCGYPLKLDGLNRGFPDVKAVSTEVDTTVLSGLTHQLSSACQKTHEKTQLIQTGKSG